MTIGIHYPLRYYEGGLQIDSDRADIVTSEIKHFLDTLKQERLIFTRFGVPIEILFETDLPEVFAARLDVELQQVIPSDVEYEITPLEFKDGKLKLQLEFLSNQEVNNRIRRSLVAIYAADPES